MLETLRRRHREGEPRVRFRDRAQDVRDRRAERIVLCSHLHVRCRAGRRIPPPVAPPPDPRAKSISSAASPASEPIESASRPSSSLTGQLSASSRIEVPSREPDRRSTAPASASARPPDIAEASSVTGRPTRSGSLVRSRSAPSMPGKSARSADGEGGVRDQEGRTSAPGNRTVLPCRESGFSFADADRRPSTRPRPRPSRGARSDSTTRARVSSTREARLEARCFQVPRREGKLRLQQRGVRRERSRDGLAVRLDARQVRGEGAGWLR